MAGGSPLGAAWRPASRHASYPGRYDDPRRRRASLYAAFGRRTALVETLMPPRPDAEARRVWMALYVTPPPPATVSRSWRERRVLAAGALVTQASLADIRRLDLRQALEVTHAPLLGQVAVARLDLGAALGPVRSLTQQLGRALRSGGHAGVAYPSTHDGRPCVALFDERAALVAMDAPAPEPLSGEIAELSEVATELGLTLAA